MQKVDFTAASPTTSDSTVARPQSLVIKQLSELTKSLGMNLISGYLGIKYCLLKCQVKYWIFASSNMQNCLGQLKHAKEFWNLNDIGKSATSEFLELSATEIRATTSETEPTTEHAKEWSWTYPWNWTYR